MISGVSNGNSDLMQLLLSAMKNGSSTGSSTSSSGISQDELNSVETTGKSGKGDFLSCLKENFSKIDSDSDSKLSKEEMDAYFEKNKPMGPPPGMFIENMNSYNPTESSELSESKETEGQGSKDKVKPSAEEVFSKLDINKDGVISIEEIAEASKGKEDFTENKEDGKSVADVFSSIFDKISNSTESGKAFEQFTRKLAGAYSKTGLSSDTLKSVLDMAV